MADETPSTAGAGAADRAQAETLEELEEQPAGSGFRDLLAGILERAPMLVFAVFSVLALGLIVGAVWLVRGRGTPPPPVLDPGAIVAARDLQQQAVRVSTALSSDAAFERAIHPLLNLAEIRQADAPEGFLADELLRLKQIDLALSIDVREALSQSTDRARTFDAMLADLIGIDQKAATSAGRIVDQQQVLRERISTVRNQEAAATAQLNASLASSDPAVSTAALGTLVAARERRAQLEARTALLEDVRDQFPSSVLALRARIAGMRANRELLVRDLTAIDVDGAGIEILRRDRAATYYDPTYAVQLSSLQGARVVGSSGAGVAIPSPSGAQGSSTFAGMTSDGTTSFGGSVSSASDSAPLGSGGALGAPTQAAFGGIPTLRLERGESGLPQAVLVD